MTGLFSKLRGGLGKTRDFLLQKVQLLVVSNTKIDENLLTRLEEILLASDVGVETTSRILNGLKERARAQGYETTEHLVEMMKEELSGLLLANEPAGDSVLSLPPSPRPYVIMVVGVNGVGKTTTIGKLAYNLRQAGHRVLIGAADTFRAAANEQLEIWSRRAGVEIVQQSHGADPASVAFDSLSSAIAKNMDVVIVDTAGRLHTKTNLMEELKKVRRVMDKRLPGAPHEVLLVLDASTGQNGIQQARQFMKAVDVTGLVVTKLDGTAKGGVVLSVSHELKIPVKYVGVGEQIDDLQPFNKKLFLDALFENSNSLPETV